MASWSGFPPPSLVFMTCAGSACCSEGIPLVSYGSRPPHPPFLAYHALGAQDAQEVPCPLFPHSAPPPLHCRSSMCYVCMLPFGGSPPSSVLRMYEEDALGLLEVPPPPPNRAWVARNAWKSPLRTARGSHALLGRGTPSSFELWLRARGTRCHIWGSSPGLCCAPWACTARWRIPPLHPPPWRTHSLSARHCLLACHALGVRATGFRPPFSVSLLCYPENLLVPPWPSTLPRSPVSTELTTVPIGASKP